MNQTSDINGDLWSLPFTPPDQKFSAIIKELPSLKRQLEQFDPIKSAALLAGLLTEPAFHANTLRIETLIHLLVAFGEGKKKASVRHINSWLNNELGKAMIALLEDPVEDVFVSNVTTGDGNTRIFEGIWENSDFYLQRILNILEKLPSEPSSNQLKREVRAILKLSEEIARRRRLDRFIPGNGIDKGPIHISSLERLISLRQTISFSAADLQRLGILSADLSPFIFQISLKDQLRNQEWGNSELERQPIVYENGNWLVLLPTAISVAIRQHILSWIVRMGYEKNFDDHLVMEYYDFFCETRVLGAPFPEKMYPPSKIISSQTVFDISREVDAGRFLHLLAIVDSVVGFHNYGFSSPDLNRDELNRQIDIRVKQTRNYFRAKEGFKQGLTLIIECGYGRPSVIILPEETSDWKIEVMSAPDIQTAAWIPGAPPLLLWKLIDYERFLAEHNVSITNANGLLNLYSWWVKMDYMLYPQIEFGGQPIDIAIPTDCIADIRKKVRQGWDEHALPLPNGLWIRVRRTAADSYFPDDVVKSRYACIDTLHKGELLGAQVGERLIWWLTAQYQDTKLSRELVFRVWEAACNWLDRAVPIFEKHLKKAAGKAVSIVLNFKDAQQEQVDPVPEDVLRACLSISTDQATKTIHIGFHDPFLGGFQHPKNMAERTLIWAITIGVLEFFGEIHDEGTVDSLVREIVPNEDARYVHFFKAIHFRDFIQHYDQPEKLFIDDIDVARSKLGLGWLVQSRTGRNSFTEAAESAAFLNQVVEAIWRRMRENLQILDRVNLIEQLLRYIEGVEADKKRWERTFRAVLALREDKASKASRKEVAMQRMARCNASEIALRLVIEMALSVCPLNGGKSVGNLDLTSLMSDALLIFNLGGCSDAIRKGVMEPEVQIASSGDILTHTGFRNEVYSPLGRLAESVRLDYEIDRYEKHFEPQRLVPTMEGTFPAAFLDAFKAEFGVSVDAVRGVREALENLAVETKKCVFIARKEEILSYCGKSAFSTEEIAEIVLKNFELWPRLTWDATPSGYLRKDWYSWRFGRQLSLLRRPLVRLENEDNARYAISPGLFNVGFAYTLSRYYEAEIEVSECKTSLMKRWVDDKINSRGHAFAKKVFDTMRSLGYDARLEVKMTFLLNDKLDKDYGDVDVLAWRPGSNDVLAIECKDLNVSRTPNEMAEQLNRFSGQILPNKKRDDLLKHLDRCSLLRARMHDVAKTIELENRDIDIHTVICFSNPVPMQYIAKRFSDVVFSTVEDLKKL